MRVIVSTLCLASVLAGGFALGAEPAKPLEVLYITGGCCHDYEAQKGIISRGLESRARI